MAYRLQLAAGDHRATLDSFLQSCRKQGSDLTLLPEDSLPVTTNSLTLSLHSPSLRSLLSSLPPCSTLSLSVPTSSSSLIHLLQLLRKGLVMGQGRQELEQVQEVAKMLGITLGDCQINFGRRWEDQEQEEEDEPVVEGQDYEAELDCSTKKEIIENPNELYCNYCGKQYKHQGHLKQHMLCHTKESLKSVDSIDDLKCSQCSDMFGNKKKLAKHILKEHGTCDECGKKYKYKGSLKQHKLSHTNDQTTATDSIDSFSCSQCPNMFKKSKKLEKHILKVHDKMSVVTKSEDASKSGIRLPCTDCDKTFAKEHKLLKHILSYHQALDVNEKETRKSGDVQNGTFFSETQYKCKNCEKSFRSNKQLYKHRESIHSGVTNICQDCDKEFSRRDKLNAHMRDKH